jgi:hypothetical protein
MPGDPFPDKIFIGTFHKTGHALISAILQQAVRRLGLKLWPMHRQIEEPDAWGIGYHYHSQFGDTPAKVRHRGVLVIRDPRDVIISGANYHCKADEPWLHLPEKRFGSLTYHQKINSLTSVEDRLIFEMENMGRQTIEQMLAAIESYPDFQIVKLETLMTDYDLMEFHKIFSFLGFHGADVPVLLAIALTNSVFSGSVKSSVHVRSGRPAQWRTQFTPRVLAAFSTAFGEAPVYLGYEPSSEAELIRGRETAKPALVSVPAALGPVRFRSSWRWALLGLGGGAASSRERLKRLLGRSGS